MYCLHWYICERYKFEDAHMTLIYISKVSVNLCNLVQKIV